ncbi:MAG: hypothetical protein U0289_02880 [Cyclobacteriaceae bacterium]
MTFSYILSGAPRKKSSEKVRGEATAAFLQERYELQVLDSYESVTYSNGQAGSIYKQSIPWR